MSNSIQRSVRPVIKDCLLSLAGTNDEQMGTVENQKKTTFLELLSLFLSEVIAGIQLDGVAANVNGQNGLRYDLLCADFGKLLKWCSITSGG